MDSSRDRLTTWGLKTCRPTASADLRDQIDEPRSLACEVEGFDRFVDKQIYLGRESVSSHYRAAGTWQKACQPRIGNKTP